LEKFEQRDYRNLSLLEPTRVILAKNEIQIEELINNQIHISESVSEVILWMKHLDGIINSFYHRQMKMRR
jgi:ABC-type hemin transport system ATPase subunit